MRNADYWIGRLGLQPHPEGGFFRETWRSEGTWPFDASSPFGSIRSHMTAIHYLLRPGECSKLHRIHSDELWVWHAGSPLRVDCFSPVEGHRVFRLGPDPEDKQLLMEGVPAEAWFGAWIEGETCADRYALVSCIVAPGFEFSDLHFADRDTMLKKYPQEADVIRRLT